MTEVYEIKTKSDRSNRKKDGWLHEKRLISLFSSCFSSSDDFESRDEVLKPLYYIAGDSSSEQMEATVESVDDESNERHETIDKPFQRTRPQRIVVLLSRFSRGVLCGFKKNRDGETASVRIRSSTIMDEIDISLEVSHDDRITQLEMKVENIDPDDISCLEYTALGVTFPHPVYTYRCRLPMVGTNQDTQNDLWTEMETNFSLEFDDYTLPPTQTVVKTATAESWGSIGSSSLYPLPPTQTVVETATAESWGSIESSSFYPTDEQSNEEGFFHTSFDSDIDIPFDEIFTDKSLSYVDYGAQIQELS